MLNRLLLLLTFLTPIQVRFYKFLRPFSRSLEDPNMPLPAWFEKNVCFYTTDIALVLMAIYLIARIKIDWKSFLFGPVSKYATCFFFIAFLSVLGSTTSSYVLQYFRLLELLGPIFLCCLLASGTISENIRKVFLAIFCIALFECAVGMTQYFLQEPIGLKLLGEQSFNGKHATHSVISVSHGARWFLDQIFHISRDTTHIFRAYGTFPHPNIFGGFLVLSILASYSLYLQTETKKVFYAFAIGLQVFTLCLTYSRAAFIAWIIASGFWFVRQWFAKENRKKIFPLGVALSVISILCALLLFQQIMERNAASITQAADGARLTYQSIALKMMQSHPILGIGFNNFFVHVGDYTYPGMVHNIYLLVGAEMGLIGLVCFLLFILSVLKTSFKASQSPEAAALFAVFLGFLFIGGCDFYPIVSQHGRLMFFLVTGMLASVQIAPKRVEIVRPVSV